jgi:hypothetical protein
MEGISLKTPCLGHLDYNCDVSSITILTPLTNRRIRGKMAGVNRFEALIRAIRWLGKRGWSLSFLLAFVSFCVIVAIPGERSNALFGGPVFC